MVELSRRWFLGGALAVAGATTIPLTKAFADIPKIVGDGIHDDWPGLQAAVDGKPFSCDGIVVRNAKRITLKSGEYRLSKTLTITQDGIMFGGDVDADQPTAKLIADHSDSIISMETGPSGTTYLSNLWLETDPNHRGDGVAISYNLGGASQA